MSDLGGFVEGAMAGQQYAQSKQMFGITMAEGQQKLQEGQQKLQEGPLNIEAKELAIKQTKLALAQQENMIRIIQSKGTDSKASPTDQTTSMADTLYQ